jgi:hypothetical protein
VAGGVRRRRRRWKECIRAFLKADLYLFISKMTFYKDGRENG